MFGDIPRNGDEIPFGSGNCGDEGEKLQKFEYLENEKSFSDEMMKFTVFKGLWIGEKIW